MRKLGIIDLLKLIPLYCTNNKLKLHSESQRTLHASASFASAQIVTGQAILWVMRIKRQNSVMILFNKLIY